MGEAGEPFNREGLLLGGRQGRELVRASPSLAWRPPRGPRTLTAEAICPPGLHGHAGRLAGRCVGCQAAAENRAAALVRTQVIHALAEVLRGAQCCMAGCKGAMGVPQPPASLRALIWRCLLRRAHGAAMGPTALTTALGGARCPPRSSKGIHAGGHGTTGQDKVITPIAVEVPTETTEPATEGAGDGYEDVGIAIKKKPQPLGRLQNHVPALRGHPHVAHSHRQGHGLTIHSDLDERVKWVRDSQN